MNVLHREGNLYYVDEIPAAFHVGMRGVSRDGFPCEVVYIDHAEGEVGIVPLTQRPVSTSVRYLL